MGSIYIQIKQVIQNKRFLMFTIFIPICWYFILSNIQNVLDSSIILSISVFIGIIGNSLATFSKRISSNTKFYTFYSRLSKYSLKKFLTSQLLVQLLLNFMIFATVLILATISTKLQINNQIFIQFILITVMGLYFSLIGFLIGTLVDSQIIDVISFPLIILAAITIIPFSTILSKDNLLSSIIIFIQKLFPGYYYNNIIESISNSSRLNVDDILFLCITIIIQSIIVILLIPKDKIKYESL